MKIKGSSFIICVVLITLSFPSSLFSSQIKADDFIVFFLNASVLYLENIQSLASNTLSFPTQCRHDLKVLFEVWVFLLFLHSCYSRIIFNTKGRGRRHPTDKDSVPRQIK